MICWIFYRMKLIPERQRNRVNVTKLNESESEGMSLWLDLKI
jgi:hypothetical protein